jgi:hypothetical protein
MGGRQDDPARAGLEGHQPNPRQDTGRKVTKAHPTVTIDEPEVFAKLQEAARIAGTTAHVMAIMSIEYMMTQLEQGKVTILDCGNQGHSATVKGGAAA